MYGITPLFVQSDIRQYAHSARLYKYKYNISHYDNVDLYSVYDIRYDMIHYVINDMRYDICDDIWYGTIWDTIWDYMIYDIIWHDMIWYDMIWYMIYDIWYDILMLWNKTVQRYVYVSVICDLWCYKIKINE